MKKLTLKQHRFVNKYLELGNATEAVMQSYNVKRRVIAAVMAKQLKKKQHIAEAIKLAQEDRVFTIDVKKIITNLENIANSTPTRVSESVRLRAKIELLKLQGTYR